MKPRGEAIKGPSLWKIVREREISSKRNVEHAQEMHGRWQPTVAAESVSNLEKMANIWQQVVDQKADLRIKKAQFMTEDDEVDQDLAWFERKLAQQARRPVKVQAEPHVHNQVPSKTIARLQ